MASTEAEAVPGAAARHRQQMLAFALMALGMFMAILDIQIVAGSLTQIQAGLSASADEIVWVQTAYLIAETVMIPLSSFLSRALSIRWCFMLSAAAFTIASLLCASATTIHEMILYRTIQGFVGGAMIPSVYAATFIIFGPKNAPKGMAMIAMIVTMAPTIGPSLGGWVTDTLSWHWLFLINVLPGIIVTIGVGIFGKLDEGEPGLLRRIDLPGLLLMALFLGGLSYVLEEGARSDWFEDSSIRIWSLVALGSAIGFFWRVSTADEPIVRLIAFRNFNYAAGTFLSVVAGVALFGLVYLYPLYLARVGHLSSWQIGQILGVTGFAMAVMGPVMGFLNRRADARYILFTGFMLLAASTWMTSDIDQFWRFDQLLVPQLMRGAGMMMTISSIMATSFVTLPPAQIKDASALLTLLRNLGGASGIAVLNTVLLVRFNLHWGRLAEAVNPARDEIMARIEMIRDMAASMGLPDPDAAAIRKMGADVAEQALVMSFADCFLLMTVLLAAAATIPFLLRRPPNIGTGP